jgi:hypothetical protein
VLILGASFLDSSSFSYLNTSLSVGTLQIYRVFQGYDTIVKQNATRTAQAIVRNGVTERSKKTTYKNPQNVRREAASQARKIMKEVSSRVIILFRQADPSISS